MCTASLDECFLGSGDLVQSGRGRWGHKESHTGQLVGLSGAQFHGRRQGSGGGKAQESRAYLKGMQTLRLAIACVSKVGQLIRPRLSARPPILLCICLFACWLPCWVRGSCRLQCCCGWHSAPYKEASGLRLEPWGDWYRVEVILLASGGAALGAAGLGGKPGGTGILGGRGYGGKPGKAGTGRYLGAGGYRPLSGKGGAKQGYGGALGGLGTSLGAGLGLGLGNGLGVALGSQAGKLGGRGYPHGYGLQPGYGAGGYPSAGRGYGLGTGSYPGAGLANGYEAALGWGGLPVGRVGKQTGYGNVYGINGYDGGYGAELGYPAALTDGAGLGGKAGLGAGGYGAPALGISTDAKSAKYGGANPGSVLGATGGQPVVSAGLGHQSKTGGYGGAPYVGQTAGLGPDASLGGTGGVLEPVTGGGVGQIPYNGAPVIPAGLEAENGYGYGPQQLNLGTDGGKVAYEDGGAYGAQPAGYGAALGAGGQAPYGGAKDGSKYGLGGFYGNRIKG
ncbi:hypothetical protein MHYP_G00150450 [Metynnis hypsauchen]